MKQQVRIGLAAVLALVLVGFGAPAQVARAADGGGRKAELQQRFKARFPELEKLRQAGKVGETAEATVEAVNGAALDKGAQKVVDAENADRAELYQIFAKDTGTTAEKVARIDAQRRIKELHGGEYYRDEGGKWHKKA